MEVTLGPSRILVGGSGALDNDESNRRLLLARLRAPPGDAKLLRLLTELLVLDI